MQVAIAGLPGSGKTTVFNAVTRGHAEVASYGSAGAKPNIGVAKVADLRLDAIESVVRPARIVKADITYLDLPASPSGLGETKGLSGEYLNHLQRADILVIVARAFDNPAVAHSAGSVDVVRDVETMLYELIFSDLGILARRLERLESESKTAKAAERPAIQKEEAVLVRVKEALEDGGRVGDQQLREDDRRMMDGFQLLTAKPLVVVVNVSEDQLARADEIEASVAGLTASEGVRTTTVGGSLEMELAQMEPDDEAEFRASMGVAESGLDRMTRLCYAASDQITFFTASESELRAWPLNRGATVQKAAGGIHSDMDRGFIRAEVIAHQDLVEVGGEEEAKRKGILRTEGKTYIVKDGDVLHILFNV